jgi:NADP-dependent 3-hydroxy acid dehydrogenase YdfG
MNQMLKTRIKKTLMNRKVESKVAVVTGASKGIGAAIAKLLAAEDASVVVNYASSKAGADTVVAAITAAGGKAVAVPGDVSKASDVDIATIALFSASEDSAWLTGEQLLAAGGLR